ncbi:MAG: hypothetical protein KGM15_01265 [Pseudomonadota bacterium]|nr:hypothetical protein [Pseudomonadota bacterium]
MSSLAVAAVAWIVMLAGGLAGLVLTRVLPEAHTSDRSRDIIGGVVGMLTLLLALVLGLLIWTAYGVTQTQKSELQLLAARALEFNLEMKQYGPEGDKARQLLRTEIVWAHEQFWGDSRAMADATNVTAGNMAAMDAFLTGLKPETDTQKKLLAAASQHYAAIGETRLLMSLQLTDPVSWPLILTVIAWAGLLFTGYGVLSRPNATTITTLGLGGAAVASALFLILELSQPYISSIRLAPTLIEQVIVDIGQ